MNAHTLGPWHVPAKELCGKDGTLVWNKAGQLIAETDCNVHIPIEVKQDNARLIAEAPAMLELLRQCLDVQIPYYDEHEGCPDFIAECRLLLERIEGIYQ